MLASPSVPARTNHGWIAADWWSSDEVPGYGVSFYRRVAWADTPGPPRRTELLYFGSIHHPAKHQPQPVKRRL
jgi:hypothetical protein